MSRELLDEFIEFAKDKYDMTIEVVESNNPDSFEKIFTNESKTEGVKR